MNTERELYFDLYRIYVRMWYALVAHTYNVNKKPQQRGLTLQMRRVSQD